MTEATTQREVVAVEKISKGLYRWQMECGHSIYRRVSVRVTKFQRCAHYLSFCSLCLGNPDIFDARPEFAERYNPQPMMPEFKQRLDAAVAKLAARYKERT